MKFANALSVKYFQLSYKEDSRSFASKHINGQRISSDKNKRIGGFIPQFLPKLYSPQEYHVDGDVNVHAYSFEDGELYDKNSETIAFIEGKKIDFLQIRVHGNTAVKGKKGDERTYYISSYYDDWSESTINVKWFLNGHNFVDVKLILGSSHNYTTDGNDNVLYHVKWISVTKYKQNGKDPVNYGFEIPKNKIQEDLKGANGFLFDSFLFTARMESEKEIHLTIGQDDVRIKIELASMSEFIAVFK